MSTTTEHFQDRPTLQEFYVWTDANYHLWLYHRRCGNRMAIRNTSLDAIMGIVRIHKSECPTPCEISLPDHAVFCELPKGHEGPHTVTWGRPPER